MDVLPDEVEVAEGSDPGFPSSSFEHSLALMDIWGVRRQFLGFTSPKTPGSGIPPREQTAAAVGGELPSPEEDPFPCLFRTPGKLFLRVFRHASLTCLF